MAKVLSPAKPMSSGTAHGGGSGKGDGPTASCRDYPKGKGSHMNASFNPQKVAASKIYVGGV